MVRRDDGRMARLVYDIKTPKECREATLFELDVFDARKDIHQSVSQKVTSTL